MTTKLYIIALLSIVTIAASAQTYGTSYKPNQYEEVIHSQQIMQTGNAYKGTVYEPFSTAMPSELGEVGSGTSSGGNKPERHIRTFITPGEEGQSEEFPIGEPWILVVMGLIFGGVIYIRQRRTTKN